MKTGKEMSIDAKLSILAASCGICSLDEQALWQRLENLYLQGFCDGVNNLKALVDGVGRDLSEIATANFAGDPDYRKRLLNEKARGHINIDSEDPKATR